MLGRDDARHVLLQLGRDAERIVDDDLPQVLDPALELVEPRRSALQPIRGADVEHQEAIEGAEHRILVEVGREEHGVLRLHAAVAAHVEVVAVLGRDHAEVLALRFGALARAARHRALQLVRAAQALVAILDPHREPDRVLDAVAAPGAAHARFDRAQRLAVGVPRFEAVGHELGPDRRQLLEPGAEHVDALAAGDLGVQPELLRDAAERDQLIGCDLAGREARHHRVRAVALDVGEKAIVGVL